MADVSTEYVNYTGKFGPIRAYIAKPAGTGPWPAVIVGVEVFGLDEHIEEVGRRFAELGYLAIVPDVYTRDEAFKKLEPRALGESMGVRRAPDVEAAVNAMSEDRREPVRAALQWLKRDQSTYVPDLQASLDYIRTRPECNGAVGAVGFCMGGGLTGGLAAEGADLQACVVYYGSIPALDKVPNIKCPVLGNYGGEDKGITSTVPQLEEAMKANGKNFTYYVYEGAPHAFNNDRRPSYHAEASKLSWGRTKDFLQKHLKEAKVPAR